MWFQWLRPPSTLWNIRGHKVPPLHPQQGDQGKICPSTKQFIGDERLARHPIPISNGLWWHWGRGFPHSWAPWPSMVRRTYTQQTTAVHSPVPVPINNWPYSQTSNPSPHFLFKKRCSQKQNQWISQYWMTYQASSMFPKSFPQILTLGHRVCLDINGEMTFEFGQ